MKRPSGGDLLGPLAVLGVALCCGAPLALAFVLTTGLGAALVASGWLLVGLPVLIVGLVLGGRYLVRSGRLRTPRAVADDGALPDRPEVSEGRRTVGSRR
ncbi:MAG: hypothetical protein HYU87_07780 [Chloroflexi bacterium]|nr:hypothetical protein [Chloroflexota bacterium]